MINAMYKVYVVIDSCKSAAQLNTAKNMMQNYFALYGYSLFLQVCYNYKKENIKPKN